VRCAGGHWATAREATGDRHHLVRQRSPVQPDGELAEAKGLKTYVIGDAFDVVSEDSGTIFANIAQA
jgi:hypothetical protein